MTKKLLVTGSAVLIGSECVRFFSKKGFKAIGIDNNMRKTFFGKEASIEWNKKRLLKEVPGYIHYDIDIRDKKNIEELFMEFKFDLIIHTASQPSHDWAAKEPYIDFDINAYSSLVLLENFKKYSPCAIFIFTSTNKVYGDRPNQLPLKELDHRYELEPDHKYYRGIDESMSVDTCLHSLFGASKLSADVFVQEYGRYFGLKTVVFRLGCLTGPAHSGAELHGFLSYLVRCFITGKKYTIYGYKGKQVRDSMHSHDLAEAFYNFYLKPGSGEVYNIGGGRFANVSILEAIDMCGSICGKKLNYEYVDKNRIGDHIWWISDNSRFKSHYPDWKLTYDIASTIEEMFVYQSNEV